MSDPTAPRRFEHLVKLFGGPAGLAKALDIFEQAVHHWLDGRNLPQTDNLYVLASRYGIDLDWLLRGVGKAPTRLTRPVPKRATSKPNRNKRKVQVSNPYPNDSDTVSVPTDAERSPVLSDSKSAGWYGITDEVRIVTAEMRDVPGKDNEPTGERFLDIAMLVNGVFVHTSPFRDHTKMTPNSGSKAAKFLRQLGPAPNSFAPSQLVGMPVKVDVALRSWTDRKSGEKVERNHIRIIAGRDFQNV